MPQRRGEASSRRRSSLTAALFYFLFDRSAIALDHIEVAEPVNATHASKLGASLMTEPALFDNASLDQPAKKKKQGGVELMSRTLRISIEQPSESNHTWNKCDTYVHSEGIGNDDADQIISSMDTIAPDVWHLENDCGDEWEISTEQYERLQSEHEKCSPSRFTLPDLPQTFTTDYVTVSIN